jgi:hypothetical protein
MDGKNTQNQQNINSKTIDDGVDNSMQVQYIFNHPILSTFTHFVL